MAKRTGILSLLIFTYLLMFIIDSFYPSAIGRYIMFAASAAVYGIDCFYCRVAICYAEERSGHGAAGIVHRAAAAGADVFRLNVYRNRLKTYFTTSLPDSYGELILFTAFGFFGFALGLI